MVQEILGFRLVKAADFPLFSSPPAPVNISDIQMYFLTDIITESVGFFFSPKSYE